MMNKTRTKNTVAIVKNSKGRIVGYLTARHEEKGYDVELDMLGYTVIAI